LDFYSASSVKQQSADIHVAPLGHIILIPSQPVFALSLYATCLAEKQQIPILWSGLTRTGLDPIIYALEASTYYATDAIEKKRKKKKNI